MSEVYIGLGSNLGDRLAQLMRAVSALGGLPAVAGLQCSRVFESPPFGYASVNAYLNAVVRLDYSGTPWTLVDQLLAIEAASGRDMSAKLRALAASNVPAGASGSQLRDYSDRQLDLDVLWWEGLALDTPILTLPHPRAHERAFVLVPWAELAPQLELQGRSIRAWLETLTPEARRAVVVFGTLDQQPLPIG
jgi:2-amino-4-hydroxy-6-hydroxymethyldihydropteridine diphosphokinase